MKKNLSKYGSTIYRNRNVRFLDDKWSNKNSLEDTLVHFGILVFFCVVVWAWITASINLWLFYAFSF